MPSVTIGRHPLTWDAKAYFTTEETPNLELRFADSSAFSRRRMSSLLREVVLEVAVHNTVEERRGQQSEHQSKG